MELRQLGSTELMVSRVGVGTWAIGGDGWEWGWRAQDDCVSLAALHAALDAGANWIDTAPCYGLGHAETLVGRVLKERGTQGQTHVFTKCSVVWDSDGNVAHCLDPNSIREEVEGSLRRLAVDCIDLYQIHWPSFPPDQPSPGIEEAIETMMSLREQGKIRYLGITNFDEEQFRRAMVAGEVSVLQPPYSLIERGAEQVLLPMCQRTNTGVITSSPLASGLLAGTMTRERIRALPESDWRSKKAEEFQEPALTRNLDIADCVRHVAREKGVPVASVAIAWTLKNPAVTGAIAGVRKPEHADLYADASTLVLSRRDIEILEGVTPLVEK